MISIAAILYMEIYAGSRGFKLIISNMKVSDGGVRCFHP